MERKKHPIPKTLHGFHFGFSSFFEELVENKSSKASCFNYHKVFCHSFFVRQNHSLKKIKKNLKKI